jgi:hypothetical protein
MEPFKKVKTSIALHPRTIAALKRLAKLEGRSVSNMLQRFIDLKLREAKRRKFRKPSPPDISTET